MSKLAEEQSQSGELAAFLLGKNLAPQDGQVKEVAATFNTSFQNFKEDKEVMEMLTFAERFIAEGEARGEARGAEITLREALRHNAPPTLIESMAKAANITRERLAELMKSVEGYQAEGHYIRG